MTPVSEEATPEVQQTAFTKGAPVGPVGNLVPGLLLFAAVVGTLALIVQAIAEARTKPLALGSR